MSCATQKSDMKKSRCEGCRAEEGAAGHRHGGVPESYGGAGRQGSGAQRSHGQGTPERFGVFMYLTANL